MEYDLNLTKQDLLAECVNQSLSVNTKNSKLKIGIKLIIWWYSHAAEVREPLTPGFYNFLVRRAIKS